MKMASIVFLKIGGFLGSICNYPEGNGFCDLNYVNCI